MNPVVLVVLRSLWVLPVFAGPQLAFLGFLAAAVQMGPRQPRRWGHAIIGGVYLVGALVAQGTFGAVPGVVALLLNTACWLAAIVHALAIFPRTVGPIAAPAPTPASAGATTRRRDRAVPEAARELVDAGATTRAQLVADEPRAPEPARAAEPIDVNKASRAQLRTLPGIDRSTASALTKERARRGGFASIEDFARAAGLQPHELARLRREAFCTPPPRPRRFGRRVDL